MNENQKPQSDFFIGGMIPTCISTDREAAASVNRKTLSMYVGLPNYRNYWKSVGYKNEMERIEVALSEKDYASLPSLMTDKWLEDVSLFGSSSKSKEGIEKWYEMVWKPQSWFLLQQMEDSSKPLKNYLISLLS